LRDQPSEARQAPATPEKIARRSQAAHESVLSALSGFDFYCDLDFER